MEQLFSLAKQLGDALLDAGLTVTTAESCTGGGIAYCLTDVPGSSQWFQQAWVTYSNQAKHQQVHVPDDLLTQYGAVSEPVVTAMAEGALNEAAADLAIAVSGVAGPSGGSADKPVGTVWFAWAWHGGETDTEVCHFEGDRRAVREQTVAHALSHALTRLSP
ncbi:CinA family protein [Salinivibrio kushneri]|uniref:CinA family protein n=1 Tax=Salinivibrio kushneri TaxID=1908198 RepID=UPI0022B4B5E5|nr:nicotinamide-nucleotide amidohydrolase family protein [Salinivibrio kushneri]WBA12913.1 nicotinamide-nucleotide amidohydrolase family protein [Salinivibrio kushneri]